MFIMLGRCEAQPDSSLLKKVTKALEKEYMDFNDIAYELDPVSVMELNKKVLTPKNNTITADIRRLLLSNTFKSDSDLLTWLIPVSNKIALRNYYRSKNPLLNNYGDLIKRISSAYCPCIGSLIKMKGNSDSSFMDCFNTYLQDSILMKEYINTFGSLSNQDKTSFILAALDWARTDCDVFYNRLINLTKEEVAAQYTEQLVYYKVETLNYIAHYYNVLNSDSLKQAFPNASQYANELSFLNTAYKLCENELLYNMEALVANKEFERYSSFLFSKKKKIIGQVVYEIGVDKPLFYIRTMKYYPREKIQNVEKLEINILKTDPNP